MSVIEILNPRIRWWNNEILGLFNILGAYNRANNRSFCTCGVYQTTDNDDYKSMNINTFQVLAVLRLDYNSLKNTNLDGILTDQQLAQIYIDALTAQSRLLLAPSPVFKKTTSFTDNYTKYSSSSELSGYTRSRCCDNTHDNKYTIELSGPLKKFVDELKKK